ncbi:MAG: hypothetical protein ACJAR5_002972 [Pseudophaeobacter arcticus]|jgi:hypothetical protein
MTKKSLVVLSLLVVGACGASSSVFTPEYEAVAQAGHPIVVTNLYASPPNSAGGVDVTIYSKNVSAKRIKYIRYTVEPYNAVGDKQTGTISRRSAAKLRDVGPIEPSKFEGGTWENSWYNNSITCIRLSKVQIEFMDGLKRTYSGQDSVRRIVRSDISNSCRVQ